MKKEEHRDPFAKYGFLLGVNYWPRKSGVRMWKEFDAAEIDAEFAQMKELGMNTVRVFPLWDDFQPIYELPGCADEPHDIGMRHDWTINPVECPEMVDPAMMEKFDIVVQTARKYDLKLIVALLTAWMSGTLFNPSWKNGRNLFEHPFMLKYQMLYCRAFAKRYANCPEIIAWEYGNEQNCTDKCSSPEAAWVWLHALASELRLHDPETPIASGMHGLTNIPSITDNKWGIQDNADAVDILTTHPYPPFTPGCLMGSPTGLRTGLHAVAESGYYTDLGKRPTLCEEMGTLGNSALSEPLTADFLRMRLYSLFANRFEGCLWWCYSDFLCGHTPPYRDQQMEYDGLGLTRKNGEAKPAALEMQAFRKVVDQFGGRMPEIKRETAIIVSDLQNNWLGLYNCYTFCIQAGLAPRFVRPDQDDLSGYKLLLAPSMIEFAPISVPAWEKVTEAVKNGAVLYTSGDGLSLCNMKELFGIDEMEKNPLQTSEKIKFDMGFECDISAKYRNRFHAWRGTPTAWYQDGTPAMFKHKYGKGTACFLSLPLELSLANTPYALEKYDAWKLYEELKKEAGIKLTADYPDPHCERYWNEDRPGHGFMTVINHRRQNISLELQHSAPVKAISIVAGKGSLQNTTLTLEQHQAAIVEITF